MAENKNGFILYRDLIHTTNHLTIEQKGHLLDLILQYVNDLNPTPQDQLMKVVFEPIKQQLKRDLVHWEDVKNKRSNAGKASAESRRKKKRTKTTSVKSVEQKEQMSTHSTVSVNDTVNVNDINIPFDLFYEAYGNKKGKRKAEALWNKMSDTDRELSMNAVAPFKLVTDPKFMPYPATWLYGRRWEDEMSDPDRLDYERLKALPDHKIKMNELERFEKLKLKYESNGI